MNEFKREIVRAVRRYEETATISSRSYNWRALEIWKITPTCGHVRTHRGTNPPTKFLICKDCARGKAPVPVPDGPTGIIEPKQQIADPIARAFIESARAK